MYFRIPCFSLVRSPIGTRRNPSRSGKRIALKSPLEFNDKVTRIPRQPMSGVSWWALPICSSRRKWCPPLTVSIPVILWSCLAAFPMLSLSRRRSSEGAGEQWWNGVWAWQGEGEGRGQPTSPFCGHLPSLGSLFSGSVKGRWYCFLLHTLKIVGPRSGISNLKLCKPCTFRSRTDFLIAHLIFVFLSPPPQIDTDYQTLLCLSRKSWTCFLCDLIWGSSWAGFALRTPQSEPLCKMDLNETDGNNRRLPTRSRQS